ncbi:methylated-DNA--[protein]-cysteine S-methyltransferase [Pseudolactococcus plantarum]|uniref:Methylated-DNA--protein-cysteine methyltransferase n=1 Tax=Pseudolactococcus plantarum TaxID=1365 RepID=A0A2A5RWZ1_9LACT|nr:methylated-DNA--[protein]-cysteine S-methyltransferase [Lactococcus plantarum]PCS05743.1 methylated-DNA--protein-cysteine methyltransferase [Lactococcus plantarum]
MVDMLTTYQSPIGDLTLASNGQQLVGLWLAEQKYFGATLEQPTIEKNDLPIFEKTKTWLDQYFCGQRPDVANLELAPRGSEFRQIVWQLLADIPYGKVMTYGHIAQKVATQMGKPSMSSQAVGAAIAHNPISIIIACHRVIASTGSLTGYAGGIENKAYLLRLEGVDMKRLYVP